MTKVKQSPSKSKSKKVSQTLQETLKQQSAKDFFQSKHYQTQVSLTNALEHGKELRDEIIKLYDTYRDDYWDLKKANAKLIKNLEQVIKVCDPEASKKGLVSALSLQIEIDSKISDLKKSKNEFIQSLTNRSEKGGNK